MALLWGDAGYLLYNDAYASIVGDLHPASAGASVFEAFPDFVDRNKAAMDACRAGGMFSLHEQEIALDRGAGPELRLLDADYSAVRDVDGTMAGVLAIVMERTDRVAAERAAEAERQRHRAMLQQMPGFAAVPSGPEHQFDYVNDAYRSISGDREYVGRTVREVFPDLAGQGIFELLDQVYSSGEPYVARGVPLSLEQEDGDIYIDHLYEPIRNDDGVIGIFVGGYDVTERVRAERRRDGLLALDDVLRGAPDANAMARVSAQMLAQTLGACRVGYGVMDASAETITVVSEWSIEGLPTVAGVHRFADFGTYFDDLRRGYAVIVDDICTDPRTAAKAEAFGAMGIAAFVDVPILVDGRVVAEMFVHAAAPRRWRSEDVAFTQDVAQRTWAAVERMRAEDAARQAHERLSASEERYRTLFERMDEGFCVLQLIDGPGGPLSDYVHVEANPAYARHTGIDYIVGRTARDVLSSAEADDWVATFRRVLETGETVRFEREFEAAGRHLEVAAFRLDWAQTRQVAVIFQDITARKRAEQALRESEARFRLMADAVPQIVWITDVDGRTEFFNKQWSDYTGITYESTTAGEVAAKHVHPDDAVATMAAFEEARRAGTTFVVEHRIRSQAGEWRWFLVRAEPYRDTNSGEITRWFGVSVDIHDRKEAEAKRDALLELDDRLREADGIAAMTFIASEVVGRAVGATAAGYCTMDGDMDGFVIERTWSAPGTPGIAGRYRMQDFGRYSPDLHLGRDVVIPDVRLDPRTVGTVAALEGAGGPSSTSRSWNEASLSPCSSSSTRRLGIGRRRTSRSYAMRQTGRARRSSAEGPRTISVPWRPRSSSRWPSARRTATSFGSFPATSCSAARSKA
ncbi:PAS domain S-box protein [Sphingomonas sp. IC-56]|nr:PAS domain S-box protein [Sphingomonas sp. IC-56]